jgi:hypothetical protein
MSYEFDDAESKVMAENDNFPIEFRIDSFNRYHPYGSRANPNPMHTGFSKKFQFQLKQQRDHFSIQFQLIQQLRNYLQTTKENVEEEIVVIVVPSSTAGKINNRMMDVVEEALKVNKISSFINIIDSMY